MPRPHPSRSRYERDTGKRSSTATAVRLLAVASSLFMVTFFVVGGSRAALLDPLQKAEEQALAGGGAGDVIRSREPVTFGDEEETVAPAIALTDDDGGQALFQLAGLAPAQRERRCITVAYQGEADDVDVVLYGQASGDLTPYLRLTVEVAAPGTTSCEALTGETLFEGTLSAFGASHPENGSALLAFQASRADESRVFRFTTAVDDAPQAQGRSASAAFVWEATA